MNLLARLWDHLRRVGQVFLRSNPVTVQELPYVGLIVFAICVAVCTRMANIQFEGGDGRTHVTTEQRHPLFATRRIELLNAYALATGSYRDGASASLGGVANIAAPDQFLRAPKAIRDLLESDLNRPCIFNVKNGSIVSLGSIVLGDNQFLRILDSEGKLDLLKANELIESSDKCWPIVRSANTINIDIGDSDAVVDWLWCDFGIVKPHSVLKTHLCIKNLAGSEIIADGFYVSCGCVRLSVPAGGNVRIAPSTELRLEVGVELGDADNLSQTFTIRLKTDEEITPVNLVFGLFGSADELP